MVDKVSKENLIDHQLESPATNPLAIKHRLKKNIIISILLFIFLAFLFGTKLFAIGVTLGAILSYFNYYWLDKSLKNILLDVTQGQMPKGGLAGVSRFIFRWIFILGILALSFSFSGKTLTLGITVGLLTFVSAAMLEVLVQIRFLLFENKS